MGVLKLFSLSGRAALVTGSSRGIGRAIALGLAEMGANVVFHYATNARLARQAAERAERLGVCATAIQADMADSSAPKRLFAGATAYLGHLDILVLNVSINNRKHWLDNTDEDFDRVMRINLRSGIALMQLAAPSMIERGWGRIVTVGSVQQVKPHPEMLIYAAAKCAQMSVVRNLAKQLGSRGITVNNLSPGVIATDRNAAVLADDAYRHRVLEGIPADRLGTPQDCVASALLLCSEAGAYINGADLLVDGGMHL